MNKLPICANCGYTKEKTASCNKCPKCNTAFEYKEDCYHLNPVGHPDINTQKKMYSLAHKERRFDVMWGVMNPGNALCAGVFQTKTKAEYYKKNHAGAYVVVRVCITPLYETGDYRGKAKY